MDDIAEVIRELQRAVLLAPESHAHLSILLSFVIGVGRSSDTHLKNSSRCFNGTNHCRRECCYRQDIQVSYHEQDLAEPGVDATNRVNGTIVLP